MVLRTHRTGLVTMTGATGKSILSNVTGKIKSIAIKPSGASTNFRIYTTKAGINEYLFGSAGAVAVVTAGKIIYPAVLKTNTDGGVLVVTANQYGELCVDSQDITIDISAGAASETYEVDILVEE